MLSSFILLINEQELYSRLQEAKLSASEKRHVLNDTTPNDPYDM